MSTEPKKTRSINIQAATLADKVAKMKAEEEGVVLAATTAARMKHKARIGALVANAPMEVQDAFFKLSGTEGEQ